MKLTNQKMVVIGVQARSNNHRLPGKLFKKINNIEIIDHVIVQVKESEFYVNKFTHKHNMVVDSYLLIPEDDKKINEFRNKKIKIIYGSEDDVLSRYCNLFEKTDPDFIVRITSDCPMIPSPLISRAITIANAGSYDFVSNAHPEFRTFYDGSDVEVISKKMFEYLMTIAKRKEEREHVTLSLYSKEIPSRFKMGHIFSDIDYSEYKFSVDTNEDFMSVKDNMEKVIEKKKKWIELYGKSNCHRF